MTIHLTPEQERRIRALLGRGAYKSLEEVVEAALTAVEQRTVPGFAGSPEELDTLLADIEFSGIGHVSTVFGQGELLEREAAQ